MKKNDKVFLRFMILYTAEFIITGFIITVIWQWLELKIQGEIRPNNMHTIIAIFMTYGCMIHRRKFTESLKKEKKKKEKKHN